MVEALANKLADKWRANLIAPRVPTASWARHVYRERNTIADALATNVMDRKSSSSWVARLDELLGD